ncbi:hypothetical protein, partial [Salmonella enterica]|uniref:hypothetical protein n=1 Tax=Salmonella enterica TaxID=28901 RepID=UPI002EBE45E5|nr:hypothetical protein [Salmonella enterica subsp. enterica serovar Paratyphi A]
VISGLFPFFFRQGGPAPSGGVLFQSDLNSRSLVTSANIISPIFSLTVVTGCRELLYVLVANPVVLGNTS